ncbi:MAG TPA: M48 family metallopeptidase [Chiayiivirga sp.]|jgi:predicted Zn-dependent protease|uniref:M48 family metallopeptidase n=1 Tax=Denitratimonas tolerans TaxID=1338420 RepID=A0AAW9R3G1_9GAMM|nr:M48 family metallopeptidase [Xanthomonadaceae bacterium]MDX9763527.1 M48 family metallopeptidase [Chiayiivirga sp.]MEB2315861.1 M48 family metallopeptidase [Xanthomonadaceae bacterium]HMN35767.1 M48 family metallopeptidase [Chiayiivirga sp.]HRN60478.1 M48 family metallopeptidase [Chiayiivirga sp.]
MNTLNSRSSTPRRRGGVRWWVILLFGLYAAWYWFSNQQEAAFTGRAQLIDSSVQEEAALGLQAYREILSQSRVLTQGQAPAQVKQIAERLVAVGPRVEATLAAARNAKPSIAWDAYDWQVSLIQSEQANAFCLPGGKIAVYTGILPIAGNDSALAAIMGHEIAHALLRHSAERMAQNKLVNLGSMAAGVAISDMDTQQQKAVMAVMGAGAQYGVLLPFSRDHESEADEVGLMLAAAACYDPREAIGLWERMGQASAGQAPPEFMSTHPSGSTRIAHLERLMPQALEIRAAFCGK